MKNKKGFTLIELLAVIVILAIIMIIAVPQILNVIESSKNSSATSSIKLLKEGIKTQIVSSELMNENTFVKGQDGCYTFNFSEGERNNNYQNLNVKNKDKFSGTTKYCSGTFTDTDLKFNGNDGETTRYLYKEGEEYSSLTGGWTLSSPSGQDNGRYEKLEDSLHIYYFGPWGRTESRATPENQIDYTGYKTLYIRYEIVGVGDTSDQFKCLWVYAGGLDTKFINHITTGTYTDSMDISSATGTGLTLVDYDANIKIYEVWLEK